MDEEAQLQELGWAPAPCLDVPRAVTTVCWIGGDGTILWANRDELSMVGYNAEEYIGRNMMDFHEDEEAAAALLQRLRDGQDVREEPASVVCKDGSVVHLLLTCMPYYDEAGCFSHTRCFARNTTATRLAEIERAKREADEKAFAARTTAMKLRRLNQKWRKSAEMNMALLHQMLPPRVAADLSEGRPVPPEAFDFVTIFFSDIEGFTTISSSVPPSGVVNLLNVLYTIMDYCASLFPVYKVETIGDAYMVVGGLPERTAPRASASAVADFALLVRRLVQLVDSPLDSRPIRLRMGIHSGPVVAGVVGNLMPRYCLFGDTVNTASRMESTGEAGRIHCSGRAAGTLQLTEQYELESRGSIAVKGKGTMTTFWLLAGADGNPFNQPAFLEQAEAEAQALIRAVPLEPTYRLLIRERTEDAELSEALLDGTSVAPSEWASSPPKARAAEPPPRAAAVPVPAPVAPGALLRILASTATGVALGTCLTLLWARRR